MDVLMDASTSTVVADHQEDSSSQVGHATGDFTDWMQAAASQHQQTSVSMEKQQSRHPQEEVCLADMVEEALKSVEDNVASLHHQAIIRSNAVKKPQKEQTSEGGKIQPDQQPTIYCSTANNVFSGQTFSTTVGGTTVLHTPTFTMTTLDSSVVTEAVTQPFHIEEVPGPPPTSSTRRGQHQFLLADGQHSIPINSEDQIVIATGDVALTDSNQVVLTNGSVMLSVEDIQNSFMQQKTVASFHQQTGKSAANKPQQQYPPVIHLPEAATQNWTPTAASAAAAAATAASEVVSQQSHMEASWQAQPTNVISVTTKPVPGQISVQTISSSTPVILPSRLSKNGGIISPNSASGRGFKEVVPLRHDTNSWPPSKAKAVTLVNNKEAAQQQQSSGLSTVNNNPISCTSEVFRRLPQNTPSPASTAQTTYCTSHGSPYSNISSMASPASHQTYPDANNYYYQHHNMPSSSPLQSDIDQQSSSCFTQSPSTVFDYDLELDQIVGDVSDMYREQEQQQQQQQQMADKIETEHLIRRNLPNSRLNITEYLNKTTQDIADEIAKSLVDRALEEDRRRLVKKKVHQKITNDPAKLLLRQQETESTLNNYVEVAMNRAVEMITNGLINNATLDMANFLRHRCKSDMDLMSLVNNVSTTAEILDDEMANFIQDMKEDMSEEVQPSFGGLHRPSVFQTTDEDYTLAKTDLNKFSEFVRPHRWRGCRHTCNRKCDKAVKVHATKLSRRQKRLPPSMQKREDERRARNNVGVLMSSLKRKIYHCNCIDCQAKRRAEGKPTILEPIVVKEVDLGLSDVPEFIPIPRKKARGRPRKYPRLDDVRRWQALQQKKSEFREPSPPTEGFRDTNNHPLDDVVSASDEILTLPDDLSTIDYQDNLSLPDLGYRDIDESLPEELLTTNQCPTENNTTTSQTSSDFSVGKESDNQVAEAHVQEREDGKLVLTIRCKRNKSPQKSKEPVNNNNEIVVKRKRGRPPKKKKAPPPSKQTRKQEDVVSEDPGKRTTTTVDSGVVVSEKRAADAVLQTELYPDTPDSKSTSVNCCTPGHDSSESERVAPSEASDVYRDPSAMIDDEPDSPSPYNKGNLSPKRSAAPKRLCRFKRPGSSTSNLVAQSNYTSQSSIQSCPSPGTHQGAKWEEVQETDQQRKTQQRTFTTRTRAKHADYMSLRTTTTMVVLDDNKKKLSADNEGASRSKTEPQSRNKMTADSNNEKQQHSSTTTKSVSLSNTHNTISTISTQQPSSSEVFGHFTKEGRRSGSSYESGVCVKNTCSSWCRAKSVQRKVFSDYRQLETGSKGTEEDNSDGEGLLCSSVPPVRRRRRTKRVKKKKKQHVSNHRLECFKGKEMDVHNLRGIRKKLSETCKLHNSSIGRRKKNKDKDEIELLLFSSSRSSNMRSKVHSSPISNLISCSTDHLFSQQEEAVHKAASRTAEEEKEQSNSPKETHQRRTRKGEQQEPIGADKRHNLTSHHQEKVVEEESSRQNKRRRIPKRRWSLSSAASSASSSMQTEDTDISDQQKVVAVAEPKSYKAKKQPSAFSDKSIPSGEEKGQLEKKCDDKPLPTPGVNCNGEGEKESKGLIGFSAPASAKQTRSRPWKKQQQQQKKSNNPKQTVHQEGNHADESAANQTLSHLLPFAQEEEAESLPAVHQPAIIPNVVDVERHSAKIRRGQPLKHKNLKEENGVVVVGKLPKPKNDHQIVKKKMRSCYVKLDQALGEALSQKPSSDEAKGEKTCVLTRRKTCPIDNEKTNKRIGAHPSGIGESYLGSRTKNNNNNFSCMQDQQQLKQEEEEEGDQNGSNNTNNMQNHEDTQLMYGKKTTTALQCSSTASSGSNTSSINKRHFTAELVSSQGCPTSKKVVLAPVVNDEADLFLPEPALLALPDIKPHLPLHQPLSLAEIEVSVEQEHSQSPNMWFEVEDALLADAQRTEQQQQQKCLTGLSSKQEPTVDSSEEDDDEVIFVCSVDGDYNDTFSVNTN